VNEDQLNKLRELGKTGRRLISGSGTARDLHPEFEVWSEEVAGWLDAVAPESGLSLEWSSLPSSFLVFGNTVNDTVESLALFYRAVRERLRWLSTVPTLISNRSKPAKTAGAGSATPSRRVFLVHGHDEGIRETVARFLEKLDLECVILHEQPNKGRTIIEKFEAYSDVSFAVVLLTSDDRGGLITEKFEAQNPRARQNVILELGFFLGQLGRAKVCALYETGVDIPSDYKGVLFLSLDDPTWKMNLIKELIAAGIAIDAKKAFG
jgi:predicted nucleotide-binding protein